MQLLPVVHGLEVVQEADGAPAPVKTSLSEETSFYYDKELKKYVNKKVCQCAEVSNFRKVHVGCRPDRMTSQKLCHHLQTASPGMSGPRQGLTSGTAGPPPARSASAMDLTSPAKRDSPRARSNLAPTPESEAWSMSVTPLRRVPQLDWHLLHLRCLVDQSRRRRNLYHPPP